MKKITYGTPEEIVPTKFCKGLSYQETDIKYDVEQISFRESARGCILEFPMDGSEQIYGFGLQLKGFNHKGSKLVLRANSDPVANTGDSHAPVPFFVSTRGYGIYFDTARYLEAHCGFRKKHRSTGSRESVLKDSVQELYKKEEIKENTVMAVEIPTAKGIDIYIFEGDNILDVVSRYNRFSGGGCEVPAWGLGTIYRMYTGFSDKEILDMAAEFRKKDLAVQMIGLEPGWQTKAYSCTYVWNEERYGDHRAMIAGLKEMGYHLNLWEHAFVRSESPLYDKLFDLAGDYEVWNGLVPDFGNPKARKIFADYHRENFVELGIDGFKLDECDNSDYIADSWSFPNCTKFGSGMDGEQYHQMMGTLYMQTILEALGETRTYSEVRNAGALAASYPFVLYSDLYDHKDFIRGVVNAGFSGLLWAPEVRDAKNRKEFLRRLQTCVFSCRCLINGWYMQEAPWKAWDCEEQVRELLHVRQSLIPMLRKAFEEYKETGKPPIRALVADHTRDPETYKIDDQYIFCDRLIVAPMTAEEDCRRVYLPEGRWRDYWTKETVGTGWFEVATEKIPVYEMQE